MKRLVLVCSVAALAAPALVMSTANADSTSVAAWSVKCDYAQIGAIDPIVSWGTISEHVHQFAGATGVTTISYPDQLRTATSTHCSTVHLPISGDQPDKSAYWVAALYTDTTKATALPVYIDLNYYRDEGVPLAPYSGCTTANCYIAAFPPNLSFVGGNAHATSDQSSSVVQWSCVREKQGNPFHETAPSTHIPASCDFGWMLREVVFMPNCISQGDTEVHNQYRPSTKAYASTGGVHRVCPAGTQAIPQVQIGFRYVLDGQGLPNATVSSWSLSQLTLSSDNVCMTPDGNGGCVAGQMTASNGRTAHADFMSAWTSTELTNLMAECFNPSSPTNCGTIGDNEN